MKQFKFFREDTLPELEVEHRQVQRVVRSREHIPPGYIIPYVSSPLGQDTINRLWNEGWSAHENNLPPGQCPYDIGTRERSLWLDGWCNRSDYLMED